MSEGISPYLANGWLDTFANIPFVVPIVCVQLHVNDPGDEGMANLSSVTNRMVATFAAAEDGTLFTTGNPPGWAMTSGETLRWISLWDGYSTGDNWLANLRMDSQIKVANGDYFQLAGGISLTITGIAETA